MQFLVRCPYCHQRSRVPEQALGSSGPCPGCGSYFTLVPEDDKPAAPPSFLPLARTPAEIPSAEAPPAQAEPIRDTKALLQRLEEGAAWTPPSAPRRPWAEPLSTGAFLLSAAAISSASLPSLCRLVIPVSAIGLLLSAAGLIRGKSRPWLPAAAGLIAAAILLVAWRWPVVLGPTFQAFRARTVFDPAAMQVIPLPGSPRMQDANPDWIDAGQAALRQGPILVRITKVWTRPDNSKSKEQHLFVRVMIMEGTDKKRPIENRPPQYRPKLTDDSGNDYELQVGIQPFAENKDQGDRPTIGREEVFAFSPPRKGMKYLRLELPGTPWGLSRPFRFTIPASMIVPGPGHGQ